VVTDAPAPDGENTGGKQFTAVEVELSPAEREGDRETCASRHDGGATASCVKAMKGC